MKKKKIKREEKLQISFETEHLPPSTKEWFLSSLITKKNK